MFSFIRSLRAHRAAILQEATQLVFEHGSAARHVAKSRVADAYFAEDVAGTLRANRVLAAIDKRLADLIDRFGRPSR